MVIVWLVPAAGAPCTYSVAASVVVTDAFVANNLGASIFAYVNFAAVPDVEVLPSVISDVLMCNVEPSPGTTVWLPCTVRDVSVPNDVIFVCAATATKPLLSKAAVLPVVSVPAIVVTEAAPRPIVASTSASTSPPINISPFSNPPSWLATWICIFPDSCPPVTTSALTSILPYAWEFWSASSPIKSNSPTRSPCTIAAPLSFFICNLAPWLSAVVFFIITWGSSALADSKVIVSPPTSKSPVIVVTELAPNPIVTSTSLFSLPPVNIKPVPLPPSWFATAKDSFPDSSPLVASCIWLNIWAYCCAVGEPSS